MADEAEKIAAVCIIPNCGRSTPAHEPFCARHRFPASRRQDGKEPCGECHLHPGETCDICGAVRKILQEQQS